MKIAITQAYVPAYRIPFFEHLIELAHQDGHEITVVTSKPSQSQGARGDDVHTQWQRPMRIRTINIFGRTISLRSLNSIKDADLIVTELDPGNLLAWRLAASRRKWVAWGHGKSYVTKGSLPSELAKRVFAKRSAHVLTYTEGGRQHLLQSAHLSPARITAVRNSTDTATLTAAARALGHHPPGRRRAMYVGGLDRSKRVDFVLAAAEVARKKDPDFGLTLIGQGELSGEVERFADSRPWVVWLRSARGAALAALAKDVDCIWMPGRVGLVAVDALALGIPVHTTHFAFHAPEIEYLVEGRSVTYLPDEPAAFARASLASKLTRFQPDPNEIPSIEEMAKRFYFALPLRTQAAGRAGTIG